MVTVVVTFDIVGFTVSWAVTNTFVDTFDSFPLASFAITLIVCAVLIPKPVNL